MYSSLKIVRKLSYAWMYYPNGLDTGFSISKGYITGDEVTSLLQIIEQGKTKRPEVYLEDVTVIDEFTGGSEITFATFYELEQYLVLLNNPLTVDIIGGDFAGSPDSNKFLIKPEFTVDGNLITIQPNGVWKINSVTYSNPTQVVKEVPLCSAGKSRLDYIVPNNSNGFDIISGIEVDSSPIAPQIPYDNLFVTFYIVTDESIQNPQEPVNNEDFVQKLEAQDFMVGYNNEVVVDKVILIDNRSSIVAINQVNEILSLEVLPQNIRPGKPVFVRNNTVSNLLLRGNSGSGNVKFNKDITIKPGDTLQFKLDSQNSTIELVGTNPFDKLDSGGYTGSAEDLDYRISGLEYPDEVLSRGTITVLDNTVSIDSNTFIVRISGDLIENVDNYIDEINLASAGFNRIDIIVLDINGNFLRIQGDETANIAVKPQKPDNTVEITSINVIDTSIDNVTPSDNAKLDRAGYNGTAATLDQKIDGLREDAMTRIDDAFETIEQVDARINNYFKGVYLTEAALIAAHPTANIGDYAQVNEVGATDVVNYNWDAEENIWVKNAVVGSAATNTDQLPEGSTNLYFTVSRFLANLTYANIIAALGFTPSQAPNNAQKNSDITKAEIEAKLTGQINTHTHEVKDVISYALSAPTVNLVTGDTDTFHAPYDFTITNFWIGVSVAPTISSILVDIKKNGTSITTTKSGINAGAFTSLTGTSPVITNNSFVKGDSIIPVISQIGSGETGKSLKIYLEVIKS